jgi:hypothetical protein
MNRGKGRNQMRKEAAVFLTALVVISLIGVTIAVIGVSTAVLAKDVTKPTSHNYKQGIGHCFICNCQKFKPSYYDAMTCKCGHNFRDHLSVYMMNDLQMWTSL